MNLYTQDNTRDLILASASPRRKELMEGCGLEFKIMPSGVAEDGIEGLSPSQVVEELSLRKANFLAREYRKSWVIGSDTVVVLGDLILGKPKDEADALRMLSLLQGRSHHVYGGISLCCKELGISTSHSYSTEVVFKKVSDSTLREYVKTKEPFDKAGSYAIQGIAIQFVKSINGSYSNVVGLNVSALIDLLISYKVLSYE